MQVFLTYGTHDQEWARAVATALSQGGHQVWVDDVDLFPGENWASKRGKALAQSEVMVVLISPDAMESPLVRRDIAFALGEKKYANRVVPVILEPTARMPWFLRTLPLVEDEGNRDETVALVRSAVDRLRAEPTLSGNPG